MKAPQLLHRYFECSGAPATPLSKDGVPETLEIDDAIIALAHSYGYPIAYAQEQDGRRIHNLFPIKSNESKQISSSSKTTLQLHTETAFHPYRPDYVVLFCVRGDTAAATTYATLDDILCNLSTECTAVLFQKRFVTSVDLSFRPNGEPDQVVLTSVLHKSESGLQLKYDRQLMRGVDNAACHALAQVAGAIDKSVRSATLEAGDALVLDNRTVVHGRSAFSPRYDGTDRWLKRALVMRNLPPETRGHVIDIASIGTVVPEPANAHRYKDTSSRTLQAAHSQSTGAV